MEALHTTTLDNGKSCTIRSYSPCDYEAVREILEESRIFDATWDSEASLQAMIHQSPTSILVAVVDGAVVSSMYVHVIGHWAYLWRLATRPLHRKQGVATVMLEAAQCILKKQGVPEVAVFVDDGDGQLKDFYTKREWQSGGVYRSMWKKL